MIANACVLEDFPGTQRDTWTAAVVWSGHKTSLFDRTHRRVHDKHFERGRRGYRLPKLWIFTRVDFRFRAFFKSGIFLRFGN